MMIYTTMTTSNDPRPKPPSAASTNLYFPAMNLFLAFFHEKDVVSSYKNMQNEPNLNISKFSITPFLTESYPNVDTWYRGKNEPKTNPNEANSKPIQTQSKHILKGTNPKNRKEFQLKNSKLIIYNTTHPHVPREIGTRRFTFHSLRLFQESDGHLVLWENFEESLISVCQGGIMVLTNHEKGKEQNPAGAFRRASLCAERAKAKSGGLGREASEDNR